MHKTRVDRLPAAEERQAPIKKAFAQVQPVLSELSPATSRHNNIMRLQQTLGNQAVLRLMAQNRLEANTSQQQPAIRARHNTSAGGIVARQCACEETSNQTMPSLQREDDSEEEGGFSIGSLFGESEDEAGDTSNVVEDTASDGGALGSLTALADDSLADIGRIGGKIADRISEATAPCKPASSALSARAMHQTVRTTWLNFSSAVFGSETTGVWDNYLDSSLSLPRPTRNFAGSGEIVTGFTKHHKSVEAEKEIVTESGKALSGSASLPAPGSATTIPVTAAMPAATLRKRLNDKSDKMGLAYDSPATTIPGNLAGGIGEGGAPGNTVAVDKDTRDVDGSLQLSLDTAGTSLTITPQLTFNCHDTVDFCPGNLGNLIAKAETVPMSILEATEGRFGPVFAADVPLNVSYPGAGTPQTVPVSKPTP